LTGIYLYGELAMRHQLRPSIDGLENKALLSHVAASLVAHHIVLLHDVQREVQRVESTSAMAVSLTTNQPAYNPGQVVKMTLTLTNNSRHNETVLLGPSTDGFLITHNDKVIWRSNDGVMPFYIARDILKPGQSVTLSAHWTVPASTGNFVVHNQMFPAGPAATFAVTTTPISPTPTPPTPILPILPTPIVPIVPVSPPSAPQS
jgi:hypothetical protein